MKTIVVFAVVVLTRMDGSWGYCPSGWIKQAKKCYTVFPGLTVDNNFHTAQDFCNRKNGELMNLYTEELHDIAVVLAFSKGVHSFTGLADKDGIGDWRWGDGSKPRMNKWRTGGPADSSKYGGENCGHLIARAWEALGCNGHWPDVNILCEKSITEHITVSPKKKRRCVAPTT